METKILFLGDIVGKPGMKLLKTHLSQILKTREIDLCIANGENAAGGTGLTFKIADELFRVGVDIITLGDHVWRRRDIVLAMEKTSRIVRPANLPEESKGRGSTVVKSIGGAPVGVIAILGRVYMEPVDCPFKAVQREIERLSGETKIIVVDFHAEATSEKIAMGWHLDGKVTAVIGTHTHVATADERVLPKGTAYITDAGMTGPHRSVIGRKIEPVLKHFTTLEHFRFDVAEGDERINGVVFTADENSGRANSIERFTYNGSFSPAE